MKFLDKFGALFSSRCPVKFNYERYTSGVFLNEVEDKTEVPQSLIVPPGRRELFIEYVSFYETFEVSLAMKRERHRCRGEAETNLEIYIEITKRLFKSQTFCVPTVWIVILNV